MHFPTDNTLYMVPIALHETSCMSLYGKMEEMGNNDKYVWRIVPVCTAKWKKGNKYVWMQDEYMSNEVFITMKYSFFSIVFYLYILNKILSTYQYIYISSCMRSLEQWRLFWQDLSFQILDIYIFIFNKTNFARVVTSDTLK